MAARVLAAGTSVLAVLGLLRLDQTVMGFVAYDDSNSTNRVDACSLLEQVACSTMEHHNEVERTIFDEIVQMKMDRTMPVFCLC